MYPQKGPIPLGQATPIQLAVTEFPQYFSTLQEPKEKPGHQSSHRTFDLCSVLPERHVGAMVAENLWDWLGIFVQLGRENFLSYFILFCLVWLLFLGGLLFYEGYRGGVDRGEGKMGEWGELGGVERVRTGENTFYERRIYFHTNKQTKRKQKFLLNKQYNKNSERKTETVQWFFATFSLSYT